MSSSNAHSEAEPSPPPFLTLREAVPDVIAEPAALSSAIDKLAEGYGPVAIDAERASGYRYSSRAYLIQLRREGAGTFLIDPIKFPHLQPLNDALEQTEWVVHAATQDLPCLREVGLQPARLFDTELAARLLGFPKVGLASLVEELLGYRMRKAYSAADWSQRPLPQPWLRYAALDVEVLVEIRNQLQERLDAAQKSEWAQQEFDALLAYTPPEQPDRWRRTSGIQKARSPRALAAVKHLWFARDEVAAAIDISPKRLLPDKAIMEAVTAGARTSAQLRQLPSFKRARARQYLSRWSQALQAAAALPESELPSRARQASGPPQPRRWSDQDPVAGTRLQLARKGLDAASQKHEVPVENLMRPSVVRHVLWQPPKVDASQLYQAVANQMARLGARPWQINVVAPIVCGAIAQAELEVGQQPGA